MITLGDKVSQQSVSKVFGDGSDGDVTVSVSTDLASLDLVAGRQSDSFQFNNLTVPSGVTLTGDNYLTIIRVRDTLTVGGMISTDGLGSGGGSPEALSSVGAHQGGENAGQTIAPILGWSNLTRLFFGELETMMTNPGAWPAAQNITQFNQPPVLPLANVGAQQQMFLNMLLQAPDEVYTSGGIILCGGGGSGGQALCLHGGTYSFGYQGNPGYGVGFGRYGGTGGQLIAGAHPDRNMYGGYGGSGGGCLLIYARNIVILPGGTISASGADGGMGQYGSSGGLFAQAGAGGNGGGALMFLGYSALSNAGTVQANGGRTWDVPSQAWGPNQFNTTPNTIPSPDANSQLSYAGLIIARKLI